MLYLVFCDWWQVNLEDLSSKICSIFSINLWNTIFFVLLFVPINGNKGNANFFIKRNKEFQFFDSHLIFGVVKARITDFLFDDKKFY